MESLCLFLPDSWISYIPQLIYSIISGMIYRAYSFLYAEEKRWSIARREYFLILSRHFAAGLPFSEEILHLLKRGIAQRNKIRVQRFPIKEQAFNELYCACWQSNTPLEIQKIWLFANFTGLRNRFIEVDSIPPYTREDLKKDLHSISPYMLLISTSVMIIGIFFDLPLPGIPKPSESSLIARTIFIVICAIASTFIVNLDGIALLAFRRTKNWVQSRMK